MSRVLRLLLVTLGLLLTANSAQAQNNSIAREDTWRNQAIAYLDSQHRYASFSPDQVFEDWTFALRSRLLGSEKASRVFRLEAGETYRIIGACDADCTDLDMEAFDSTGASVALDRAYDDHPILDISPISTDDFTVKVWWASCAASPCYAGVRVLRRTAGSVVSSGRGASGTGFLVSADGYIVTNNHVIDGARRVMVLIDGNRVPAEVISRDPANDIALLHAEITGSPLSVVSSESVSRGSDVFTLGFPMVDLQGEEQKAAFGRVNAMTGISDDVRYLQIDVPIQPGNSGGPLINSSGQVVGIVSATLNQSAALRASGTLAQNVNYAVKSDYLLPLLPQSARNLERLAPATSVSEAVARAEGSVFRILAE